MRRFEFNLETVLRWREQQEDQAMQQLADATVHRNQAEAELHATDQEIQQSLSPADSPGSNPAAQALQREAYLHRLHNRREAQELQAAQATDAQNKARQQAARAQANREGITRLRASQHDDWERSTLREEEQILNEIASSRHIRKREV